MGSAGRHRSHERPGGSTDAEGAEPSESRWRRLARRTTLGLVLLAAGVGGWWLLTGWHRRASDRHACQSVVEDEWVQAGRECLHFEEYQSASVTTHPDLVVVVHGDAPFQRPGYQYVVARRLSTDLENVIAVGLLRPGYTDDGGRRSSGVRGRAIGDNYTAIDIDAVAAAIKALAQTYLAGRVFLVGHSGGAAIVGDILGRHPDIATGAILVSCPCDVPAWRRHMATVQHVPLWRLPVQSLSPLDLAARVDPRTAVHVVVGTADRVTPPAFSRSYVQRLQAHGVRAELVEIPGAGHEILLDPRVLATIEKATAPATQP